MYICVYMHTNKTTYIHEYKNGCTYMYIHTYIHICVYLAVCVYVYEMYMYVCAFANLLRPEQMHIHMYVYPFIYRSIYLSIYLYICNLWYGDTRAQSSRISMSGFQNNIKEVRCVQYLKCQPCLHTAYESCPKHNPGWRLP